jgi:hypothetical protein
VCDQAKNVKAAFSSVVEAESSEEILHKLIERQNKIELKAERDKLFKEKAMKESAAEAIRINEEILEFNKASSQDNHDLFSKGKTRAEILANFDEDLADDNTDEITMSDYEETENDETAIDEDEDIELNESLNSSTCSNSNETSN